MYSFDEEAIPPETVEYMARVASEPDIRFRWYCVPIAHRNACSRSSSVWYPWAEEDRDKWVRPLPPLAVRDIPGFKRGFGIPECVPLLWGPEQGTVCHLLGIRTQESMTRYRAVCMRKGDDAFLGPLDGVHKWAFKAYPIYDWPVEDVWLAPSRMGWDYNRAYDVMRQAGLSPSAQRCAPPFGEQPLRGLYRFKICWPDLWAKMTERVPGAATAARYANTELYGIGQGDEDKPADMTWESYALALIKQLDQKAAADVATGIRNCVRAHAARSHDPIPDAEPHPVSGFCWKSICTIARIGGNKLDRQAQKVRSRALAERSKRGIKK